MDDADDAEPGMLRREVVLPDGRILIFYTFDEADGADE